MNDVFQDLSIKQDLFKVRIFFLCAAICSPIFYFFMKHIQIGSIDSLFMRIFIFVLSLIGLMVTYLPRLNTKLNFFLYSIVRLSYLALYLYMLSVNHWTMYQRWAYFVLASILCGSALSWKDYLFVSFFSVLAPLILGLLSSIPAIEQIHFLAANLATFVIIGLSVSSHYHFKSEVVNLTNSLIEKSQMAVLGEIAASISHEMNTPLMIFTNSLHQISRKMSPEIKAQYNVNTSLDRMFRMSERISKIVNSLKAYSDNSINEVYEKEKLSTLVDEALLLSNRKILDSGISLKRFGNANGITCIVKRYQIIQCLLNLLNNAIEACNEMTFAEITLTIIVKEYYVSIIVSDNGPGVPEELTAKIMHPFFTTKVTGKSVGLGLSVSQKIAENHRGSLYLDRTISNSSFVLKLPISKS